jgi:hypothetical protein
LLRELPQLRVGIANGSPLHVWFYGEYLRGYRF